MRKFYLFATLIIVGLLVANSATASAAEWDNGAGDDLWMSPANWAGDVLPTGVDATSVTFDTPDVQINSGDAAFAGDITLKDDGVITMTGGTFNNTNFLIGNGSTGTFNMLGGTINGTGLKLGGAGGNGTINMSGGVINLAWATEFGSSATGTSTINMTGGSIIQVHTGALPGFAGTHIVDMSGDALISFSWHSETVVQAEIDAGNIIAYGGAPGAYIELTHVSQYEPVIIRPMLLPAPFHAWIPAPVDGSTGLLPTKKLSWTSGFYADRHNVYFGNSTDDVSPSAIPVSFQQSENLYDPGPLDFSETYYWRIDEVNTTTSEVWTGDVWSFTAADRLYCSQSSFADLDGDFIVNLNDTAIIAAQWMQNAYTCDALQGDLDGDAVVNEQDLIIAADTWLDNTVSSYIETATTVGIENGKVRLEFDSVTGKMVVLTNLVTGDNYLKGTESGGNPFRAYVDTTQMPAAATQGFPFPVQPVEGAMGGVLVDPANCQLISSSYLYGGQQGVLSLQLENASLNLTFDLDITVGDGDPSADLNLTVRNTGVGSHTVMTAIPYLTGLSLGANSATNIGMRLGASGSSADAAPAWDNHGGVYGQIWGMQWDAVYDVAANETLGVLHKDSGASNKIFHRFSAPGMSTLYFDKHTLNAGQSFTYPPVELVINQGSWKVAARRYGDWFQSAFTLREKPEWSENVTQYIGLSWLDTPYNQMVWKMMLFPFYDIVEYAHYWENAAGGVHSIGSYVLRNDLGGIADFAQGVAQANALKRYPGLYVAAFSLTPNDPLMAGENPNDWLLMQYPGETYNPSQNVDGHFFACVGYTPWRDHLVQVVKRLAEDTGAKAFRLDEFGGFYWPCYNPVHGHSSPYKSGEWMLDFARRVREALDLVDPNIVLLAEGVTDAMHQYLDGGYQLFTSGKDISPMTLAVPGYTLISHHLGAADSALDGLVTARRNGANEDNAWFVSYFNGLWGPGGAKKPTNYDDVNDPFLKWNDLSYSFLDATFKGDVIDVNPFVVDPVQTPDEEDNWDGRMWKADDYYLMVCGNRDASDLAVPTKVKLPYVSESLNYAYEFNVETLEISTATIEHNLGDTYVTTTHGLSAVLLPLSDCRPMILSTAEPFPTLIKGGSAEQISLIAYSPWKTSTTPMVNISAPGLLINGINDEINIAMPATISLSALLSAVSGDYVIYITSEDCIPLKRWFKVN